MKKKAAILVFAILLVIVILWICKGSPKNPALTAREIQLVLKGFELTYTPTIRSFKAYLHGPAAFEWFYVRMEIPKKDLAIVLKDSWMNPSNKVDLNDQDKSLEATTRLETGTLEVKWFDAFPLKTGDEVYQKIIDPSDAFGFFSLIRLSKENATVFLVQYAPRASFSPAVISLMESVKMLPRFWATQGEPRYERTWP